MKKIIILLLLQFIAFTKVLQSQSQITENWSSRYNGAGDYSDKYNCITIDNSGNIYLGGYTDNIGQNRDFLTAKINANGDTLWTAVLNGKGNGQDEVQAIAVDASGNVYVTGFCKGDGTGDDFLTVKYNSSGDTAWTKTYNYSANEDERANSIAVDAGGNVFVTGQSDNDATSVTNDDYVTIKYNSSGAQQWVQRFNGAGNATDRAVKIVLDNSGNSYVTGRSDNGADDDFVTIKYNASGVQQWIRLNDGGNGNDRAAAMAIDGSANIYIAGRSDNGTDDDFATVKYNSAGVQQWIQYYDRVDNDRATAIALDASGNVYVTGQSDNDPSTLKNYDYLTVKYNSAGALQWTTPPAYNGAGSGDDIPSGIAIDNSGNVYVTGSADAAAGTAISNDYATVKYNSAGVQQWVKTLNGGANQTDEASALVLDNSANVYVTGGAVNTGTQRDASTLKYSSAGVQLWQNKFVGTGDNSDNTNAITVDVLGNTYLAGYSVGTGTDRDMCVIKMNSQGDTLWVKKYNGTSNFVDEANDIEIDGSGNVYVTGFTKNSGVSYDYTTIKYNSNGDTLWVRKYNSPFGNSDKAASICIGAAGNIYVTGSSNNAADTYDDIVTINYTSAGVQQWVARYDGAAAMDDIGIAVKSAPSGNVYVAGTSSNGTDDDFIIIMYNSAGVQQWKAVYDGGNGADILAAMLMDNAENIYVTGSSKHVGGLNDDFVTAKYNSSGAQQWAQRFNGLAGCDDLPSALAIDGSGNVYVTGTSAVDTTGGVTNYDFMTVKYNSAGAQQWAMNYNGQANMDDIAHAIVLDYSGNVIITGESEAGSYNAPDKNYLTIMYNPQGAVQWYGIYNGAASGTDNPNSIAYNNGKVYVSGGSWGNGSQKDILVIEYNSVVGINEISQPFSGILIYPQPATDIVNISFTQTEKLSPFEISIADITGREIMKENSYTNETKTIDISAIPPGIYFVYCNRRFVDKMVVVR